MANPSRKRRVLLIVLAVIVVLAVSFLRYFPGRQSPLAFTLITGVGASELQKNVDRLEEQAIHEATFSADDTRLLADLYTCLAKIGSASIVLGQSGRMMRRYLDRSGTALPLHPRIFTGNQLVRQQMQRLLSHAQYDLQQTGHLQHTYVSPRFYMPHPSSTDAVFGLYYGRVVLRPAIAHDGVISCAWRAEVPWVWPSYRKLRATYGNPHAECFALPNLRSLLQGKAYAVLIDNGLGEYLTHLGMAKSFLAYAEWTDKVRMH